MQRQYLCDLWRFYLSLIRTAESTGNVPGKKRKNCERWSSAVVGYIALCFDSTSSHATPSAVSLQPQVEQARTALATDYIYHGIKQNVQQQAKHMVGAKRLWQIVPIVLTVGMRNGGEQRTSYMCFPYVTETCSARNSEQISAKLKMFLLGLWSSDDTSVCYQDFRGVSSWTLGVESHLPEWVRQTEVTALRRFCFLFRKEQRLKTLHTSGLVLVTDTKHHTARTSGTWIIYSLILE